MTNAQHIAGGHSNRSGDRPGYRPAARRRGVAYYLAFVILKLAAIPVVALAVGLSLFLRTSPYAPAEALLDLVARGGCPAAAAVGLAPARRGALGYHARNDTDGDGIACEREPAARVRAIPLAGGARRAGGAKFVRPARTGGG